MKKIIILLLIFSLNGCFKSYIGEKTGIIVELDKKYLCNTCTWRSELISNGVNAYNSQYVDIFNFRIEKSNLVPIVREALMTKKQVRIRYYRVFFYFLRTESKDYFLDSVEFIR